MMNGVSAQRPPPPPTGGGGGGFPPPYRSPPTPGGPSAPSGHPFSPHQGAPPQGPPPPPQGAYSKFNVSEPNINGTAAAFSGSPATYRHTMNQEHSQHVQHGLRNIMNGQPKHSTLDSTGQSVALQQLRNSGVVPQQQQHPDPHQQRLQNLQSKLPMPGDTYVSPDNLRDAASRMFARNHADRSSIGNHNQLHHPSHQLQQSQFHNRPPNGMPEQPYYSNHPTIAQHQQQHDQQQKSVRFDGRMPQHQQQDDPRRNSYANNSFRQATGQQQDQQQPKQPPQVPPKPNSRSTSRERLRESMEDVDNLDQELKHILRSGNAVPGPAGHKRTSLGCVGATPPLPALSPDPTPESSPSHEQKQQQQAQPQSKRANRPDLLEHKSRQGAGSVSAATSQQQLRANMRKYQDEMSSVGGQLTADLESVLGGLAAGGVDNFTGTSDGDDSAALDATDAAAIRRQLDGLEGMYSEVLKLLGLRKYGRGASGGGGSGGMDRRRGNKMYGSMSSLPSVSSIGSRHLYGRDPSASGAAQAKKGKRGRSSSAENKSHNKRFQRLESHVVTLARSVAHLSSEMRSQQLMAQEVEALRMELQQLRSGQNRFPDSAEFRRNSAQAHRVRKLTKFFGDEPPLLRLFLKNLGYEKFASSFEEAKIGLLELPFLSEDRLERLGVPMGPRMRIMQEARQGAVGINHSAATPGSRPSPAAAASGGNVGDGNPNNYNVYIL